MDRFPRKPLLDRIIVREIPVKDYYRQSDDVVVDLDNSNIKILSDRGTVVAVGDVVPLGALSLPMPVVVGDIVYFDEFALCDPVLLNPADKNRTDLPKYWQMRVADLKGIDVENREKIVDEYNAKRQAEIDKIREAQATAVSIDALSVN